jgi:hypothetical protein
MENIRHCHDTWVGGYSFYFFPVLAFCCCCCCCCFVLFVCLPFVCLFAVCLLKMEKFRRVGG